MSTRTDKGGPWSQWLAGFQSMAQGPAAQVYKEWETWLSDKLEKLATNDTFLSQTAKSLEGSFHAKALFDRMLETSLRGWRLPSASDLESVHKRLDEIERRLDALAAGQRAAPTAAAAQSAADAPVADAPKATAPRKGKPS